MITIDPMETVNPKILEMFTAFNAPVHKSMDEMKEIVRSTRESIQASEATSQIEGASDNLATNKK
ncbi:MAG: hypothetical protein ACK5Z2_15740 [Bacteroidota bacterium]|jgi:hypothetical protein